jgi:hypothetical protein
MVRPTKSHADFVAESRKIHGDAYEYPDDYKRSTFKIRITCKTHGDFLQLPTSHLTGRGCKLCFLERHTKKTDEVVNEFRKTHGDLYDYPEPYVKGTQHMKIRCKTHGLFKCTPSNHIRGKGCPKCACNKTSKEAKAWLKSLNIPNLQTFDSPDGEYKIKGTRWKADGYDPETNTIYEYHGSYFHANPSYRGYSENEIHPFYKKLTWKQVYDKTIQRDKKILELGYNLVIKWGPTT